MISDDNIATAQIAQLFGSELLRVQEGARTDSGSKPNILNIDPKQFLTQNQSHNAGPSRRAEEQHMIKMLQQEAEAAYPVAPVEMPPQQLSQQFPQHTEIPTAPLQQPQLNANVSSDVLERIASSLERIANRFEDVDLSVKKRRIKRSTK